MHPSIKAMLNTSIALVSCTGQDGAGKRSYGAASTKLCYLEGSNKLIVTDTGRELTASGFLVFDNDVVIKPSDQVTLPSGKTCTVIVVEPYYDEFGAIDHFEVYV